MILLFTSIIILSLGLVGLIHLLRHDGVMEEKPRSAKRQPRLSRYGLGLGLFFFLALVVGLAVLTLPALSQPAQANSEAPPAEIRFVPASMAENDDTKLKATEQEPLLPLLLANSITGTVFRDFDSDGVRDTLEPGVEGITVIAYLIDGSTLSDTTDADGLYAISSIPIGEEVRLEIDDFSLPSFLQPGPSGADSATTVSFPSENDTNVDIGLVNPAQYCQTNPKITTPCYVNGDPQTSAGTGGNDASQQDVLVSFNYDGTGTNTYLADGFEIGTNAVCFLLGVKFVEQFLYS